MKHISQRVKSKILQTRKCWMAGLLFLFSNGVFSEITLDGSLGPKGPLSGPNYEVKAGLGRQAGGNLYHSFETFNIHQGESATFSGPNSVANILSRVTGGSSSTINGLLRSTIPGADFYLINPAGVLFGPHASLDVQGSFHVGSADYIGFPDGLTFDAHDLQPPVTLSVASPESFGFLGDNPGNISLFGANLNVTKGETLSIIGGDIVMTNGFRPDLGWVPSVFLSQEGGVNITSVQANGEVNINDGLIVNTIDPFKQVVMGKIIITNGSLINVFDGSNKGIFIQGGEFTLSNNSRVVTSINESGGDLSIRAANNINLSDSSVLVTQTIGNGDAGDLIISSSKDLLMNNSLIGSFSLGDGNAGNLAISVENLKVSTSLIRNNNFIQDQSGKVIQVGQGNTGALNINAKNEVEISGGLISNTTFSQGRASSISISTKKLILRETGIIEAATFNGEGADIDIDVRKLDVVNNSSIRAVTQGSGKAGNINIESDHIHLSGPVGTKISNNATGTIAGSGDAGEIRIKTKDLEIEGGAQISASTNGPGDGSNVEINADNILLSGTDNSRTNLNRVVAAGIFANTYGSSVDSGKAGNLTIHADNLVVLNGAQVSASTWGKGDGGKIEILSNMIFMKDENPTENPSGTGIFSSVQHNDLGNGNGGQIRIQAESLKLGQFSMINTSTSGQANGGNIEIFAKEIELVDRALIDSSGGSAIAGTEAGDIKIDAENLYVSGGSQISASSFGPSKAGNLDINAENIVITGSELETGIYSNANGTSPGSGDGGNLWISSNNLTVSNGAQIVTGTYGSGDSGNITVNAKNLVIISGQNNFGGQSGIFTNTLGSGVGGDLSLSANQIKIVDRSGISAKSTGTGDAGNILVQAKTELNLSESGISTNAELADGGNITVKAKDQIKLKNSTITASVKKGGNGGNIDIDPQFVILDNSQIIAQAEDGSGGNINLTADFLFASPNSIIDASSDRGINGQVNIDAPDTDILGGLEGLPANFLDAASILSKPCAARTDLNHIRMAIRDYVYEVLPQGPDVLQVHLPSLSSQTEFDHQQNVALKSSESSVMQLSALSDCHESM